MHLWFDSNYLLLSCPERFGGLGIPLFFKNASFEYESSRNITLSLSHLIKDQSISIDLKTSY